MNAIVTYHIVSYFGVIKRISYHNTIQCIGIGGNKFSIGIGYCNTFVSGYWF